MGAIGCECLNLVPIAFVQAKDGLLIGDRGRLSNLRNWLSSQYERTGNTPFSFYFFLRFISDCFSLAEVDR